MLVYSGMTEKKRNFKYTYLSAVFLAVLILISPCKVRNSIESALGIKQSNVVNKFKAGKEGCCLLKTGIVNNQQRLVVNTDQNQLEPLTFSGFEFFQNLQSDEAQFSNKDRQFGYKKPVLPFYILYGNFKVYHS